MAWSIPSAAPVLHQCCTSACQAYHEAKTGRSTIFLKLLQAAARRPVSLVLPSCMAGCPVLNKSVCFATVFLLRRVLAIKQVVTLSQVKASREALAAEAAAANARAEELELEIERLQVRGADQPPLPCSRLLRVVHLLRDCTPALSAGSCESSPCFLTVSLPYPAGSCESYGAGDGAGCGGARRTWGGARGAARV